MSQQNNNDISHIQVPDSFIQEILSETQPLKEGREEVHPPQAEIQAPESGEVVKLLSLMFEEFDKLNARINQIQISLNEATSCGSLGTGYSGNGSSAPRYTPTEAQNELEGRASKKKSKANKALEELLRSRIGR